LRKIISQIESNGKKSSRGGRKARAEINVNNIPEIEDMELPTLEEQTKKAPSTLEELKAAEEALSNEVIELEKQHVRQCADHRDCAERLRAIDKDLDKLRSQLDKCAAEYQQVVAETRKVEDEMERTTAERREKNAQLEEVRNKIEDLSKVVIFVSNDGSIEVAEGEIALDEGGFEELYGSMRDDEQYETFRIIDIKTLARAICIKRNTTVKTEFMFDNAQLEQKFLQIA
jgi:chromosome segregation ATPase